MPRDNFTDPALERKSTPIRSDGGPEIFTWMGVSGCVQAVLAGPGWPHAGPAAVIAGGSGDSLADALRSLADDMDRTQGVVSPAQRDDDDGDGWTQAEPMPKGYRQPR